MRKMEQNANQQQIQIAQVIKGYVCIENIIQIPFNLYRCIKCKKVYKSEKEAMACC
jgi:hypothetical protein